MAASIPKQPNLNGRLDGKRCKLNLEGLEYIDREENNNKERIAETDIDGE